MQRAIVGFHRDDEWHWVQSAAGRASRIGSELDCVRCDRGESPLRAAVGRPG